MTKPLVLAAAASEELRRAIRHYEDERPGLGVELADLVEKVFHGLASGTIRPVTVPAFPSSLVSVASSSTGFPLPSSMPTSRTRSTSLPSPICAADPATGCRACPPESSADAALAPSRRGPLSSSCARSCCRPRIRRLASGLRRHTCTVHLSEAPRKAATRLGNFASSTTTRGGPKPQVEGAVVVARRWRHVRRAGQAVEPGAGGVERSRLRRRGCSAQDVIG